MIQPTITLLIGLLLAPFAWAQPRLVSSTDNGYREGQRVDPQTWLLNARQEQVRLVDLIRPETRVAVVIFFGGAAASFRNPDRARGALWCPDSFDDLAVQRALVRQFEDQPVQFIPVAVPPVYHPERFGYGENTFVGRPDEAPEFREAVSRFIQLTEAERARTLLPFDEIYYDPRFRLAYNSNQAERGPEYGVIEPWQGRFRWHLDPRPYGTPSIWLLDGSATVLRAPFVGNDYDAEPPEISYGFAELKAAIEKYLREP